MTYEFNKNDLNVIAEKKEQLKVELVQFVYKCFKFMFCEEFYKSCFNGKCARPADLLKQQMKGSQFLYIV